MSAAITLLARFLAAVVAVFTLLQSSANAQEKLKIGIITTLSAAAGAVPGQQQRNGFELAVKMLGGKLGGREAEIVVADDELKPDVAVAKVKALVDRDRVAFVVGPIFSNILAAIVKPVTDANVFLISPNAGTSSFAGKDCNPNLFVTSYQNDQVHEVLGQYAQESGMKKVIIIVPNYQAGKDAAAGFKHKFGGEILDEMYVPLGQLDYSAELTRIAAANPDAIFAFPPGGMGVTSSSNSVRPALRRKFRSSRPSPSMNRRCPPSRTPRWACSPAPTGRPIWTIRRTTRSWLPMSRNTTPFRRPMHSRPMTPRC